MSICSPCAEPCRSAARREHLRARCSSRRSTSATSSAIKPRVNAMGSLARFSAVEPRVLFLAAAYDPHDDPTVERRTRSRNTIHQRKTSRCIRLLKGALGERFTGGFASSPFTQKLYPDLIAPGSMQRRRRATSQPCGRIPILRSHYRTAWVDRLEARRIRGLFEGHPD